MKKKKVAILGHFGVGKTSLVKRFVFSIFSEKYLSTIGVQIDKKVVTTEEGKQVTLIIWDIAGEEHTSDLNTSYLRGVHGVLYIVDLSRVNTYEHLPKKMQEIQGILGGIPTIVIGNKKDLLSEQQLHEIDRAYNMDIYTSAKEGDGVEEAFSSLVKSMLDEHS